MSPAIRRLFRQPPQTSRKPGRGGARPDPYFADPEVVEDDYRRLRQAR
jgi:hypothetical protein